MIYELTSNPQAAAELFAGWEETFVYACLQGVMGRLFADEPERPRSACAFLGCFAFFAGEPNREMIERKPAGALILVPRDESWGQLIEECLPQARKVIRYAIRKDTRFDRERLTEIVRRLPQGYQLCPIDGKLYDACLKSPVTADFVSSFSDKAQFLSLGRGMVILKDGAIVSGASSFGRYREGIEIEVDTVPSERRKGLASVASAALILRCLDEHLYPSWDAQNLSSVGLARKLGYSVSHEYTAYELDSSVSGLVQQLPYSGSHEQDAEKPAQQSPIHP